VSNESIAFAIGVSRNFSCYSGCGIPGRHHRCPCSGDSCGVSASQQPYEDWEYTERYGWVGGPRDEVTAVDTPLRPNPGTSPGVISACRDALMSHAQRFDVASLEVVSGGKQLRSNGRIIAPLDVRAVYKIHGVHEVKRSKVRCVIDRAGRVTAPSDTACVLPGNEHPGASRRCPPTQASWFKQERPRARRR
jgi:hypothetical protein